MKHVVEDDERKTLEGSTAHKREFSTSATSIRQHERQRREEKAVVDDEDANDDEDGKHTWSLARAPSEERNAKRTAAPGRSPPKNSHGG